MSPIGDGREAGDESMEPEGFTFEAGFLETWQRYVTIHTHSLALPEFADIPLLFT